jgi:hypothetical protein
MTLRNRERALSETRDVNPYRSSAPAPSTRKPLSPEGRLWRARGALLLLLACLAMVFVQYYAAFAAAGPTAVFLYLKKQMPVVLVAIGIVGTSAHILGILCFATSMWYGDWKVRVAAALPGLVMLYFVIELASAFL